MHNGLSRRPLRARLPEKVPQTWLGRGCASLHLSPHGVCCDVTFPEGPSTKFSRTLVPNTIPLMDIGTRNLDPLGFSCRIACQVALGAWGSCESTWTLLAEVGIGRAGAQDPTHTPKKWTWIVPLIPGQVTCAPTCNPLLLYPMRNGRPKTPQIFQRHSEAHQQRTRRVQVQI